MRNIFFPLIILLAGMVSSCQENEEYTLNDDCVINSFTLGSIQRVIQTKTDEGNDTTITTTITGSEFKMTIDQINNKIYNKDSLPKGSKINSVLATLSSIGSVAYCTAGVAEPEWKIYSSSDSIDFTNILTFRVVSNDGKAERDYEVKINVHQQDGDEYTWTNQKVAPLTGMSQAKAVFWKNQIFVAATDGNGFYALTHNPQSGDTWTKDGMTGAEDADIRSLTVFQNTLFMNTHQGGIIRSDNGIEWTASESDKLITTLLSGSNNCLYALADGMIQKSADGGATWAVDQLDSEPTWLPSQDVYGITYSLKNGNQNVLIVGNRNPQEYADTTAVVWSKLIYSWATEDNNEWMYYPNGSNNPYLCPNLKDLSLVSYNYSLIALGGASVQGNKYQAMDALYVSKDNGITWKQDEALVLPESLKGYSGCVTATVDPTTQHVWLITGKEVWKVRLNSLGFQK